MNLKFESLPSFLKDEDFVDDIYAVYHAESHDEFVNFEPLRRRWINIFLQTISHLPFLLNYHAFRELMELRISKIKHVIVQNSNDSIPNKIDLLLQLENIKDVPKNFISSDYINNLDNKYQLSFYMGCFERYIIVYEEHFIETTDITGFPRGKCAPPFTYLYDKHFYEP